MIHSNMQGGIGGTSATSTTTTVRVFVPAARTRIELEVYRNNDPVSAELRGFGVWQRPVFAFLQDLLKPGSVYVDVGAHVGYFAISMAKIIGPTGKAIAFEPNPENATLLAGNAARNGVALDIRKAAVSNAVGIGSLQICPGNRGGHSILNLPAPSAGAVPVETTTLSASLEGIPRVHCVKVDVQGAEMDVLDGLVDYLTDHPPPYIVFELNPTRWLEADPGLARLKSFLERHRYDVHLFAASTGVKPVPPRLEWLTFDRIVADFMAYSHPETELDVLLAPAGYWAWALKRYGAR